MQHLPIPAEPIRPSYPASANAAIHRRLASRGRDVSRPDLLAACVRHTPFPIGALSLVGTACHRLTTSRPGSRLDALTSSPCDASDQFVRWAQAPAAAEKTHQPRLSLQMLAKVPTRCAIGEEQIRRFPEKKLGSEKGDMQAFYVLVFSCSPPGCWSTIRACRAEHEPLLATSAIMS
jgi:hypothetical protein